jgi:Ca2+-binding EF-hand superfamily protein
MFLTPGVFLKLPHDSAGRVDVNTLMQFINRKLEIDRISIQLQFYDMIGEGYLRECDLENFVYELVPTMRGLDGIQQDFIPFYVYTAVRKFMFFLDPRRRGRIAITDILSSSHLSDLLDQRAGVAGGWFSLESAQKIYTIYLSMDKDDNGMLSRCEVACIPTAMLNQFVVDRIFTETVTFHGEVDFKGYLDLLLAIEHRPVEFWWKIIDVDGNGIISEMHAKFLIRSVIDTLTNSGKVPPFPYTVDDIYNEIRDMLGLFEEDLISRSAIRASKLGSSIVALLTDANAFYLYDNRESFIAQATHATSP